MQLKGIAFLPTSTKANERTIRDTILQIASLKPKTLILVQPEGHYFVDAISLDYTTSLEIEGEEALECDMAILDELNRILPREGVMSVFINPQRAEEYGIDYSFQDYVKRFIKLTKKSIDDFKVVSITAANLEKGELLETGRSIREAVEVSEHSAVLVVFSSIENEESNYSRSVKDGLKFGEFESLLTLKVPRVLENEYTALLIGLGATDKLKTFSALFGAKTSESALLTFIVERVLKNKDEKTDFTTDSIIAWWQEHLKKAREALIEAESDVLKMVRASVELWVKEGTVLDFDTFAETGIKDSEVLERLKNQRTGVFIRILKNGKERGNMGTVTPVTDDIAHEMINNSIEAASYDQRFVPIEVGELDELTYEVYVLNPPESITDKEELDPEKYGLILEQGLKRGVVLPKIEPVESVDEQIELAKERAGIVDVIDAFEPLLMSRFTVEAF